jgi:glycoprotein endo-alpha-1,2-mannosidase
LSTAALLVYLAVLSKTLNGCELSLVVDTASDWASVRFSGSPVVVLDQRVLSPGQRVGVDAFHISQPFPDSTGARVSYRIMLPEPVPEEISVTLTKGDIGWVTLSFCSDQGGEPLLEISNTTNKQGDPLNEETTAIDCRSLLEGITPETYDLRPVQVEKLVLAFYYPWYGSPEGPSGQWVHWDPSKGGSSSHRPLLGYYDSGDQETIRRHLKWARESGIDVLIVSWWGAMDAGDLAFQKLLEMCGKEHLKVCLLMEKAEGLERSLEYVHNKYFASPAYLRIDGRQVVFYYERVIKDFGMSDFVPLFTRLRNKGLRLFNIGDGYGADVLGSFDGCYSYNPVFAGDFKDLFTSASIAAHIRGKLYAATVVPGFDQTVTKPDGRFLSRDYGRLYERMWEQAIEADPEWVLVTSFNEWHEGTEIEPSEEFGTDYLGLTGACAERFKSQR